MENKNIKKLANEFDYKSLKLAVGIVALCLPALVYLIARPLDLESISASYYSPSRDLFVGLLFFVGAFLMPYSGASKLERILSKVAGLSAFVVALCPTLCPECGHNYTSTSAFHLVAAALLFGILAYFCFIPYRNQYDVAQPFTPKKIVRNKIYWTCGWVMIGSIVAIVLSKLFLGDKASGDVMFWGETLALMAFGVAWLSKSHCIGLITDHEELYKPFSKH